MHMKKLVFLLVLLASFCGSTARADERPGTIAYALQQRDGATIVLDAVMVESVSVPAISALLSEIYESVDLITVFPYDLGLHAAQTVDVAGTIQTAPNGQRVLQASEVKRYLGGDGTPLAFPLPLKRPDAPTPWPWKESLIGPNTSQQSGIQGLSTLGRSRLGGHPISALDT